MCVIISLLEREAMEAAMYQQDPLIIYGGFGFENGDIINGDQSLIGCWDSPSSSVSPETFAAVGVLPPLQAAATRRKRRRNKPAASKNTEEIENQRITHIAVERNRRRQMNDYLAVLRSLMPPSYAQRGDQASIIGGAINFVKELEQLLQFLKAYKFSDRHTQPQSSVVGNPGVFPYFSMFPRYSRRSCTRSLTGMDDAVFVNEDIEVTMAESHANIKIVSKRRPKQLLKIVTGFHSICLNILHLNITTVDQSVIYSFSVKVEDECGLKSVNDVARAVHEMVGTIQKESTS